MGNEGAGRRRTDSARGPALQRSWGSEDAAFAPSPSTSSPRAAPPHESPGSRRRAPPLRPAAARMPDSRSPANAGRRWGAVPALFRDRGPELQEGGLCLSRRGLRAAAPDAARRTGVCHCSRGARLQPRRSPALPSAFSHLDPERSERSHAACVAFRRARRDAAEDARIDFPRRSVLPPFAPFPLAGRKLDAGGGGRAPPAAPLPPVWPAAPSLPALFSLYVPVPLLHLEPSPERRRDVAGGRRGQTAPGSFPLRGSRGREAARVRDPEPA